MACRSKFYNLSTNQKELANKRYAGKLKITNVDCGSTVEKKTTAVFGKTVAMSGTIQGNPWEIVSDHGIRYVGKNPDNYVSFNNELWRIIGIFNEKYDTNNDGIPDTEGDLIKIIRNDSLGSMAWDYKTNGVGSSTNDSGSNDWSDSQLMMMLNPSTFLNSGYVTEGGTATHSNTINDGYVVSGGINIFKNMGSYFNSSLTSYKPYQTSTYGYGKDSSGNALTESTSNVLAPNTFTALNSTAQGMIATVKWYLVGTNSSSTTASAYYDAERNGSVVVNSRPKIWYGKVGLMYSSDYGFATNGILSTSENGVVLTRSECLTHVLYNWRTNDTSTNKYNCAATDWLLYTGSTSSSVGSRTYQWTITPYSSDASDVFYVHKYGGYMSFTTPYNTYEVRHVLYLSANVKLGSGSGTSDSPFTLLAS